MEPGSATSHRGFVSWQGLLLTASLLTFWNPPTTAQLTTESVPFNAAEGEDVLLLVHNVPADSRAYLWFKGEGTVEDNRIATYMTDENTTLEGPAYSHRETIYLNGSLLFQNITQGDTGFYTLQVVKRNFLSELASVQLRVYPVLPKPSITSNNSDPVEGKDSVVLTCEPETQNTTYLWWMNGQSLQNGNRLNLSDDGRILTLFSVTRNGTGPYECETRNLVSGIRSDPVTLNISYGPDAPVILASGSYFLPGTNLSLSCHAASNPPAQYFWFFNENYLQSTQELFLPSIAVNDSGSYTCSVYNPATGLNRTTTKNITVIEPLSPPSIQATNTTVAEGDSVVLTCLSNDTGVSIRWIHNDQSLRLTERMTLSQNSSALTIAPVWREDAGEYQCEVSNPVSSGRSATIKLKVECPGPSDNSPNKVDEIAYSSLNFNVLQTKQSTSDSPSSTITETVYSEVKKK
ncbi:carcinoembryonic antigen-related cell adhesion molecule 1 isoform X2 [Heterocephalus glaber]|uniref:Carcinoembryonic antigen-related cell adhesion molecule 1 isoform X2 n=1 Tax=Heterocephalus glaber TaxID=10181 RepID=A0AAX6SCW7_HETGA|nr:carcinoembryonic antigen-related cell adhesion molecule 1 isoform X2 [Heterocephalus glaber]